MKRWCWWLWIMLFAMPTFAWNATGHLVIAQIAYDQLTPTAKASVDRLVQEFSMVYPAFNTFPLMATWADALRTEGVSAFDTWHYINWPIEQNEDNSLGAQRRQALKGNPPISEAFQGLARREPSESAGVYTSVNEDGERGAQRRQALKGNGYNVVWAIHQSITPLTTPTATPFTKAFFLAFLAHFVGDAHQPLHCSTLYSPRFPDGDAGGNLFPIRSSIANNLHTYWDQAAGFYQRYRHQNHLNMQGIPELAKRIEQDYPPAFFKKALSNDAPIDWTLSANRIARDFAYHVHYNQRISPAYQQQAQRIAEQQTALAGYRLAKQINRLFA